MFKILRNEKGQGMVEYILIVVFVVVAGIVVWQSFGDTIAELVKDSNTEIQSIDVGKIAGGKK